MQHVLGMLSMSKSDMQGLQKLMGRVDRHFSLTTLTRGIRRARVRRGHELVGRTATNPAPSCTDRWSRGELQGASQSMHETS